MARTLILVRHGKAQKPQLGLADADRALVPGAAEALAATYRTAFALLRGMESAELWVSPALRARQTAAQVSRALVGNGVKIGANRELPCLLEQDADVFHKLIEQSAEDTCIVAVGHIPFMEDELVDLTGIDLSFAPGSAAALRLEVAPGRAASGAELLWFVRGPRIE